MNSPQKTKINIESLESGQQIWEHNQGKIQRLTYLMPLPGNEHYHILIDQCEKPVRLHEGYFEVHFVSKQEAVEAAIEYYEDELKKRKKWLSEITEAASAPKGGDNG